MEGLVARLEAAVGRLETAVTGTSSAPPPAAGSSPAAAVVAPAAPTPLVPSAPQEAPSVVAFEELMSSALARLVVAGDKLGGKVQQATQLVLRGFQEEKTVIKAMSQCKKPGVDDLQKLVGPVGATLKEAGALTEGKKTAEFNHLKAVAESLAALVWVVWSGKDCGMSMPVGHVEESWQASEFYVNKILVEHKNKSPEHVEWARALKELYIPALRDYVKKFHLPGPAWNPKGGEVATFKAAAPPSAPKGPPPPPPPPPPPSFPVGAAPAPTSAPAPAPAASMSAVLASINKGEAVTAGLKKVTADMKTKNRTDRSGSVPGDVQESGKAPAAPAAAAAVAAPASAAPPVFELQQGRKWVVESQIGAKELIIKDTEPKQTVYIYGCKNSVITVQGKVNNITLDKCVKTAVVFDHVVAAFEVVNCSSVEVQCKGSAPTIAVDNSAGCQLYLGAGSLGASITTAKSSEVNVLVPGEGADADDIEHAMPEQFVHKFEGGRFQTTPVSHSGG